MKRFLLLFIVVCFFVSSSSYAMDQAKDLNNKVQKKSELNEPSNFGPYQSSYPNPFVKTGTPITNPRTSPAISTGYYFVDSDENVDRYWRTDPTLFDTTEDEANWRRIVAGPNIQSPQFWIDNPAEGYRFFRNPDNLSDSTDNAFAGPIPIGFKFVFNGIPYDSFYVGTNGVIMLSNSRYYYNANGYREQRNQPDGTSKAYNPNSMDWFVAGRNNHTSNGITDAVIDNYGWLAATGGPSGGAKGGIRNPDANINTISSGYNAAVLAPCYGDLCLSQWDSSLKKPEDYGKVKFYKDRGGNKLIIYYINAQIAQSNNRFFVYSPYGYTYSRGSNDLRPNDNGYASVNCQVILDKKDSSVSYLYYRFDGQYSTGISLYYANEIFRYNTTSGVSGYARHYNYNSKKPSTTTYPTNEYRQYTHYYSKYLNDQVQFPRAGIAVKFKQWKNSLRVCDLAWRVRKQVKNSPAYSEAISSSESNNFEILAGHDQVGQIQPVAIIENLTNDIQGPKGINYQPQDLRFNVRLTIMNEATQKPVFNKIVTVDSLNLANKAGANAYEKVILSQVYTDGENYVADTNDAAYYNYSRKLLPEWNGIPPYGFVQIYFPPFEPNYLYDTHIGRLKAYVMADPTDPKTSVGYKDNWPFDDTLFVRFFVMRRNVFKNDFTDDVTEYHVIYGTPMPSVLKWVNINGEVVPGEVVSRYPLPPRGEFEAGNRDVYPGYYISSPTIKLNRKDLNDQNPPGVNIGASGSGGDELRSFPIDLTGKIGAILSLSVQRVENRSDRPRGWSDGMLVGCEHRVIVGGNWYNEARTNYDQLLVEFAKPSADWKTGAGLTNIPAENWKYHPRRGRAAPVTNMSAFALFGGGGYMVGFLETDKDSAFSPPVYSPADKRAKNGLRDDIYDDGIDFEYHKYVIPIPDTFITASYEGAKNFRFRIKVDAYDNQLSSTTIPDDRDDFFVDNIKILFPNTECLDVEITSAKIDWSYTIVPASQAIAVPIKLEVNNNTSFNSPSFWMRARIVSKANFDAMYNMKDTYKYSGNDLDSIEFYRLAYKALNQASRDSARRELYNLCVYCRSKQVPFLRPGATQTILMQNWNARECPQERNVLIGMVDFPGGDDEPLNDTTYSPVEVLFGPVFAYDPVFDEENLTSATNSVVEFTGIWGRGLNLYGYTYGGTSSFNSYYTEPFAVGDAGGNGGSGSIAMKFNLLQDDTLKGFQAYWAATGCGPDEVAFKLYDGENEPGNPIPNAIVETTRGWDDLSGKRSIWDKYVTVTMPGVVLKKGTYWVVALMLMETGWNLGATSSKSAMRITNVYTDPSNDPYKNGTGNVQLNLEKSFRYPDKNNNYLNQNLFVYENGGGSGKWMPFTPTTGNGGYGHLNYIGAVSDGTITYSRGAWIPFIRPYLGNRVYAQNAVFQDCFPWEPVELVDFNGEVRNKGIDLFWLTASEINNYGFHVEKKTANITEDWNSIGFVKGNGTTNTPQNYNYFDSKVTPKTTYQYRLRQVDADGSESCESYSDIVTLYYDNLGSVSLEQNSPNPFEDRTTIKFFIPLRASVKLDIVDLYGNVICTLRDQELVAGTYTSQWDTKTSNGKRASAGTYIYRLSVGKEVFIGKMSLIR